MKFILMLVFISCLFAFESHYQSNSIVFYDFNHFTFVNITFLRNTPDLHPTYIKKEGIKDFIFRIGGRTMTNCSASAMACIQYSNNSNYYAVTSLRNLGINSALNLSFNYDDASLTLGLPKSSEEISLGNLKKRVQLFIKFKCSSLLKNDSFLSEIEPLTYLLEIYNINLCPHIFDYISHSLNYFRKVIGAILILTNIFLIIPIPYDNLIIKGKKNIHQLSRRQLINYSSLLFFQILSITILTVSVALCTFFSILNVKTILMFVGLFVVILLLFTVILLKTFVGPDTRLKVQKFFTNGVWLASEVFAFLILYSFIIINFNIDINNILNFIIISFSLALIGLLMYKKFSKKLNDLAEFSRLFFHFFLFVRGVAVFIGGYPNELIISTIKETGETYLTISSYYYLILIIGYPIFAFKFYNNSIFVLLRKNNPFFAEIISETIIKFIGEKPKKHPEKKSTPEGENPGR